MATDKCVVSMVNPAYIVELGLADMFMRFSVLLNKMLEEVPDVFRGCKRGHALVSGEHLFGSPYGHLNISCWVEDAHGNKFVLPTIRLCSNNAMNTEVLATMRPESSELFSGDIDSVVRQMVDVVLRKAHLKG